ncbi:aminotransferase class I/II-fold pyridoxal phosphate-dependent enzyme [Oscillospiraceae bacterium MB08-C2-2]|nr:aminotransferase class I/II-fold pyridoxal phosphate-dependent enzyme [Oscillospiraceae bacterium MB08-C2-2]
MSGNTPLREALEEYLAKDFSRLHMPGHKGLPLYPFGETFRYDVTEVEGTDSLYQASGAIAETEKRFSALYGTAASLLSAGGSTLCIQAMLALAVGAGGKVIAARNAHIAAVSAMALLDIQPVWVSPRYDEAYSFLGAVEPAAVAAALAENPDAKAVYITSPSYFGILSDIPTLAALCHSKGVFLLVDNAHGAHLPFVKRNLHPIAQGADLCCDSLHKTLPVLTGGALLHIGNPRFVAGAKAAMALFGSTSPSYLIMLSMDAALPYLEQKAAGDFAALVQRTASLQRLARARGFFIPDEPCDPTRLTIGFGEVGMTREAFSRHLREYKIEPEYLSHNMAVLLPAPQSPLRDWGRLYRMLDVVSPAPSLTFAPPPTLPQRACSLREAVFAPKESIPVDAALGRVAGELYAPCPPGVPLAVAGEILDEFALYCLKSAGLLHVNVLQ